METDSSSSSTQVKYLDRPDPVGLQSAIERARSELRAAGLDGETWSEPSQVIERSDAWDMWFAYRTKLVEVEGRQVVEHRHPPFVQVEVSKGDGSARIIPGR